jgi:hypothetical protein
LANGSPAEIAGLTKENERDKQRTTRDFTSDAFLEIKKKNVLYGSDFYPSVHQPVTFVIPPKSDG